MDRQPTCSTLAAMTARVRRIVPVVALSAAAATAGCGVIPGPLPMWAADTLGEVEIERPRPAIPDPPPVRATRKASRQATDKAAEAARPTAAESTSEFALLPDRPEYLGGD